MFPVYTTVLGLHKACTGLMAEVSAVLSMATMRTLQTSQVLSEHM